MKRIDYSVCIGLIWLFISCTIEPEAIAYGHDACSFCKMTIVDQQHSAQFVTEKGKQFKFDAIECLLNDLSDKGTDQLSIILIADYGTPSQMTNAQSATYLISKEIKSPMGAFLSGFSSLEIAKKAQQESGGQVYSWSEIKQKFEVR